MKDTTIKDFRTPEGKTVTMPGWAVNARRIVEEGTPTEYSAPYPTFTSTFTMTGYIYLNQPPVLVTPCHEGTALKKDASMRNRRARVALFNAVRLSGEGLDRSSAQRCGDWYWGSGRDYTRFNDSDIMLWQWDSWGDWYAWLAWRKKNYGGVFVPSAKLNRRRVAGGGALDTTRLRAFSSMDIIHEQIDGTKFPVITADHPKLRAGQVAKLEKWPELGKWSLDLTTIKRKEV